MTRTIFAKYSCLGAVLVITGLVPALGQAQTQKPTTGATPPAGTAAPPAAAVAGIATPAGYLIGPEDALAIVYWREKELSAEVIVRPDGMISLPLLNDIRAEGLTPDQLRTALTTAASKFVEDPTVTVVVKAIHSRKVYVTGQVGKPGPYALGGPTTVLQLLSMAGGLAEYAKKKDIKVFRTEGGKQVALPFNYEEILAGKRLQQNIELKPGDVVTVP